MIKHLQSFHRCGYQPAPKPCTEEYLTTPCRRHAGSSISGRTTNIPWSSAATRTYWAECRTVELERDGGTSLVGFPAAARSTTTWGNLNFTFSLRTEDYDLRRQQSVIAGLLDAWHSCRNFRPERHLDKRLQIPPATCSTAITAVSGSTTERCFFPVDWQPSAVTSHRPQSQA